MADWPSGIRRIVLEETSSTNDVASEMGRRGESAAWVFAKRQTHAKGRRGRAWLSGDDNFAASLLLWPDAPIEVFAQLSFATALALFDTIQNFKGPEGLSLKWPNDVLQDGRKISGILLETTQIGDKSGLVIGIGVNLNRSPDHNELEERSLEPTHLGAYTSSKIAPEAFLDLLALNMDTWVTRWTRDGFAPVRESWLARASGLGANIVARLPDKTLHGTFEDVDHEGNLILRTSQGAVVLPAGDIYFASQEGDRDASGN